MLKKISLGYFFVLLFAASLNYIPGLTNTEGQVFGIFALDIFDDSLHVASALWALLAALYSQRSAKMFLVIFGILYLGDGVFGFLTGYGYLDLGIFTNDPEGLSFYAVSYSRELTPYCTWWICTMVRFILGS